MKSIKYDKIIRDRIPEIIEKAGKKCVLEVLEDEQYYQKLVEKLQEETQEFIKEVNSKNDENALKELADIEEVILAIVEFIGIDKQSFNKIREAKKQKNGGFDKRLLLKEVIED